MGDGSDNYLAFSFPTSITLERFLLAYLVWLVLLFPPDVSPFAENVGVEFEAVIHRVVLAYQGVLFVVAAAAAALSARIVGFLVAEVLAVLFGTLLLLGFLVLF